MQKEELNVARIPSRRGFMAAAGVASAALLGSGLIGFDQPAANAAQRLRFPVGKRNIGLNDYDILNFALNLEYLEAEYYLRATTGGGLDEADKSGIVGNSNNKKDTGAPGMVTGGTQVPFVTPLYQQIAVEISRDELAHVRFLRAALGDRAVAEPSIDLSSSFTTAAIAAGVIQSGQTFNPFENESNFLLGAYIFEDVGVTAYHGAAQYISNSDYLNAAAGILGTEAYHAGGIRTLLLQAAQTDLSVAGAANLISVARAKLDGTNTDDQGITDAATGNANLVPAKGAIVFGRTPQQVLDIVYLGATAAPFGFFPNKLNGRVQ